MTAMAPVFGGPGSGPRPGYRRDRVSGTGTKDDPIRTGNVQAAAQALGEGKFVELNQPDEVATLLDELKSIADEAIAKGEKAPTSNLCNVSVAGTNLFCVDAVGVPRVEMPQFRGKPTPGSAADALPRNERGRVDLTQPFISHLEGQGVAVSEKTVPASHLRASQSELDGAKVAGIVERMDAGTFDPARDEPIFVTKDNYVVDGHHRWAAMVARGLEANGDMPMPVHVIDMPIVDALAAANAFTEQQGVPHAAMKSRVAREAAVDAVFGPRPSTVGVAAGGIMAAMPTLPQINRSLRVARAATLMHVVFGGEGSGPRARLNRPFFYPNPDAPNPNQAQIDGIKAGSMGTKAEGLTEGTSTDNLYRNPGWTPDQGLAAKYTPERAALHEKIISDFLDHVQPPEGQPIATFLGGGPAAGKSTIVNSGAIEMPDANDGKPPAEAVLVNADSIKDMLPEYEQLGKLGDAASAGYVHEESSDVSKMLMAAALDKGVNITIDGTGDGSSGLEPGAEPGSGMAGKITEARDAGHVVNGVYATVPTGEAHQRNLSRYEELKADGKIGRLVPEPVVAGTHASVSRIFPDVAPLFDHAAVYTTMPEGGPALLAETTFGQPIAVADQAGYDEFLGKKDGKLAAVRSVFAATVSDDEFGDLVLEYTAAILRGAPFSGDRAQQALWGAIGESIFKMQAEYPDAVIEIPADMPSIQGVKPQAVAEAQARVKAAWSALGLDAFGGPGSGPRKRGPGVENTPRMTPGGERPNPAGPPLPPDPRTTRGGGPAPEGPPRGGPSDPPAPPEVQAAMDMLRAAAPEPSADQAAAVKDYTADPAAINEALRTGSPMEPDASAGLREIEGYLAGSTIPEDVTVYRAMDLDPAVAQALVPGAEFQNPGLSSTTITPPGTTTGYPSPADLGSTVVEISVPAGYQGAAYVGGMSKWGDANREVLFAPGMNLRVDSAQDVTPSGAAPASRIIQASIIPSHSQPQTGAPRGGLLSSAPPPFS